MHGVGIDDLSVMRPIDREKCVSGRKVWKTFSAEKAHQITYYSSTIKSYVPTTQSVGLTADQRSVVLVERRIRNHSTPRAESTDRSSTDHTDHNLDFSGKIVP